MNPAVLPRSQSACVRVRLYVCERAQEEEAGLSQHSKGTVSVRQTHTHVICNLTTQTGNDPGHISCRAEQI
ncbi:hypothetical protein NDU88_002281 [Pleurodeles waltl]|uniref:Uncharacterized protein n=1 Tax=Pleurodeles waltl TaxID=8319 RepID=A0AAV7MMQ1_PLEWA|nr:hypothetical protein NDU88_002281 [Pleurodeles waltl]